MKVAIQVQILDETVCILHSTNTVWKGVNPTILSPPMKTGLFNLGMTSSLGEGKL